MWMNERMVAIWVPPCLINSNYHYAREALKLGLNFVYGIWRFYGYHILKTFKRKEY